MIRSKLFALVIATFVLAGGAVAEEKAAAPAMPGMPGMTPAMPGMPGMTPAMTAMMNPMMYGNMMGYMMNPMSMMTNPSASCAQCHTQEDVDRYNKTMGPMMAMMNPGNWMNPNAYMAMMAPMMDPKVYTEWYNAMMKKYGATAGSMTGTKK